MVFMLRASISADTLASNATPVRSASAHKRLSSSGFKRSSLAWPCSRNERPKMSWVNLSRSALEGMGVAHAVSKATAAALKAI